MTADLCRAAVEALDRALEERPDKVYDDLVEAVRCLVRLRAQLVAECRAGERWSDPDRCNAVLSMVIGAEYPLAGLRRERVRKAREELASLLMDGH